MTNFQLIVKQTPPRLAFCFIKSDKQTGSKPGKRALYLDSGAFSAGRLVPVEKVSGTLLPAGPTRMYPCISWCSAEQKSVQ